MAPTPWQSTKRIWSLKTRWTFDVDESANESEFIKQGPHNVR
jgi:hypothetical protein